MENGFSSPCTGYFPAGLRVLVVDDDPTWLKILEQMLRRCFYEVTTCSLARVALNMLRERKDGFDIVISDVNMPDMDGFKLLKHVGLEMDLPVIMMSVDGETSRVMKGVLHGACDYLLKPVRMKELQNIWQHVFRKKKQEGKDMEGHDSNDDIHNSRNRTEDFDNVHLLIGGEPNFAKKRKDMTNEEDDEQPTNDSSAVKKPRVVWSMDLHKKFVDAVKEIGLDKVGPKKILGMMRIPGLTRESVASHLQKYRLYLGRLQKQNELNTPFGGAMQSDFSSKYSPGSSELLSSIMIQQTDLANSGYSDDNFFLQDTIPDSHEHNLNGVVTSLPTTDAKQDFTSVADAQKLNQMSQRCFYLSVGGMALDVDPVLFKPTTSNMHCESVEAPIMQFKKHHKQDLEPFLLSEEGHSHLQLPAQQHHILADSETKAASTDYQSNHDSRLGLPLECTIDSMFSAKLDSAMVNPQVLGPKSSISDSLSTKNSGLDRNCTNYLESPYRDPTLKSRLVFASMFEDLQLCSLQGYSCFENLGLNAMEFLNNNGSISPIELENHHYDKSWFGFDDEWDLMEYPILWEGLFIT